MPDMNEPRAGRAPDLPDPPGPPPLPDQPSQPEPRRVPEPPRLPERPRLPPDPTPGSRLAGSGGERRRSRSVAVAVALLLVAAAAAGYSIQAGLGPIPIMPSAGASGPATSTTSAAGGAPHAATSTAATRSPAGPGPGSAAATPFSSRDLQAEVATVEAQVPPLRQLQPLAAVPTRIIDAGQLRAQLEQQLDAPASVAAMSAEQDLLVRLGLAQPGLDLRALQLATLSSQVLGLYDPAGHDMTIVNRVGDFGLTARFTIAHEYTHALQDQHFDFARLGLDASFPTDRVLALHALVEGDATLLSGLWMQAHIGLGDLLDMGRLLAASLQPVLPAGTPALVGRTLLFPYLDGLAFATALHQAGGWAAVDAAYARPPVSTAEILHPDRYAAGWTPIPVVAPDLGAALGKGWTRAYLDTMGELTFQVWLSQAMDATAAAQLAASWQGDQVVSWTGPTGAWAIAWRSAWATAAAAGSASATAGRLLAGAPGAGPTATHRAIVSGRTVTLLIASDRTTMDRILPAAGP
jgi:hypothetical protein